MNKMESLKITYDQLTKTEQKAIDIGFEVETEYYIYNYLDKGIYVKKFIYNFDKLKK